MKPVVIENPVINSPFAEPKRHFRFSDEGITNEIVASRRVSSYFIPIASPRKKNKQQLQFDTEWTQDRIEALETFIYLAEVAKQQGDTWIENDLRAAAADANPLLYRIACKMAIASGKTVVMAMLIAWQTLNKLATPQDGRFTDMHGAEAEKQGSQSHHGANTVGPRGQQPRRFRPLGFPRNPRPVGCEERNRCFPDRGA